jgi:hypothetical protein
LLVKNDFKHWYNTLEKLITDKEYRLKELKKQVEWVKKNRSTEAIGQPWEIACQLPGGLSVANQR